LSPTRSGEIALESSAKAGGSYPPATSRTEEVDDALHAPSVNGLHSALTQRLQPVRLVEEALDRQTRPRSSSPPRTQQTQQTSIGQRPGRGYIPPGMADGKARETGCEALDNSHAEADHCEIRSPEKRSQPPGTPMHHHGWAAGSLLP
jgi:hypothetical protein